MHPVTLVFAIADGFSAVRWDCPHRRLRQRERPTGTEIWIIDRTTESCSPSCGDKRLAFRSYVDARIPMMTGEPTARLSWAYEAKRSATAYSRSLSRAAKPRSALPRRSAEGEPCDTDWGEPAVCK